MTQYVPIFFELYDLLKVPYTKTQINYKMFLSEGLDSIFRALQMVSKHQEKTKVQYKIIFCFGDILQLDWKIQNALYQQCLALGLAFGLTVKLQEKNFKYLSVLQKVCAFHEKKTDSILHSISSIEAESLVPDYLQKKENKDLKIKEKTHTTSFYHYIDVLLLKDKNIFNVTNYIKNIQTLIKEATKYKHDINFSIYVNKQVLIKYSPQELKNIIEPIILNQKVILEFDPNLPLIKQQLHYPYINTFEYMREFYSFSYMNDYVEKFKHNFIYLKEVKTDQKNRLDLLAQENIQALDNIFQSNAFSQRDRHSIEDDTNNNSEKEINFFDYVETKFFIDMELNVYYSFESIYGNLSIFQNDKNTNRYMLGNLKKKPLDVILSKESLIKEEMANKVFLEQSIFNCKKCLYYKTCFNNAIGLLRREHSDFEKNAGHCFGIKNF